MDELAALLADQDGVVSRRQVWMLGQRRHDIARMVRRRELAVVHPGVYVDHTGTLTWKQRAWAAVLLTWPAALSHDSAVRAGEGPGRRGVDDTLVHVAVAAKRHLVAPPGVEVHRMRGFATRVQWGTAPPRVRYDDALLRRRRRDQDRAGGDRVAGRRMWRPSYDGSATAQHSRLQALAAAPELAGRGAG